MSAYCLSIGGTLNPTVSEKPVKSLGKVFNRSLKDPSSAQKTCQNNGSIWGKGQSPHCLDRGWLEHLPGPILISSHFSETHRRSRQRRNQQQQQSFMPHHPDWTAAALKNPPQLLAIAQDWRLSVHFEIVPPEYCHRHPEDKHPPGHRGYQKHPPRWK